MTATNGAATPTPSGGPRGDLVYDVGMHNGDDTALYLRQGFRVLAIEADPDLARHAEVRFAREIESGRLTILNVGIAERSGSSVFWIRDDCSIWNSFDRTIAARNGGLPRSIMIPTLTFGEILDDWGTPLYLKIDIEGCDHLCVLALAGRPLPRFISVEAECVGDDEDLDEAQALAMLELLYEVGYRRFKLICQEDFSGATTSEAVIFVRRVLRSLAYGKLRMPGIARIAERLTPERRVSRRHRYRFPYGSSGPWGESASGRWLELQPARRLYLNVRRRHFRNAGMPRYSFWYDWHATY